MNLNKYWQKIMFAKKAKAFPKWVRYPYFNPNWWYFLKMESCYCWHQKCLYSNSQTSIECRNSQNVKLTNKTLSLLFEFLAALLFESHFYLNRSYIWESTIVREIQCPTLRIPRYINNFLKTPLFFLLILYKIHFWT